MVLFTSNLWDNTKIPGATALVADADLVDQDITPYTAGGKDPAFSYEMPIFTGPTLAFMPIVIVNNDANWTSGQIGTIEEPSSFTGLADYHLRIRNTNATIATGATIHIDVSLRTINVTGGTCAVGRGMFPLLYEL